VAVDSKWPKQNQTNTLQAAAEIATATFMLADSDSGWEPYWAFSGGSAIPREKTAFGALSVPKIGRQ
jgi:hypothetical protein